MGLIKDFATVNSFRFQEGGYKGEKHPYCACGEQVSPHIWGDLYIPDGFKIGKFQFETIADKGFSLLPFDEREGYDNTEKFSQDVLDIIQQLADCTNKAIALHNKELLNKFIAPTPLWMKEEDLALLSERLTQEFGATIHRVDGSCIAEYEGQVWNVSTGEGEFVTKQGKYDYMYLPSLGQNLAQRLPFLSLRQSLSLSRETVKSFLHRPATKLSNDEFESWFEKFLGQSSWKSKYWIHHDIARPEARVSVVANHSKDMLVVTTSDGIHVFSKNNHFIIDKLPRLFYKFARIALSPGKDYAVSATGWALTW